MDTGNSTQKTQDSAKARILANPFAVPESDLAQAKVDLVFRLSKHGNALRAFPLFKSRVKKLLEEVPGAHYLRSEKAYFFPAAAIAEFLRLLRSKKLTFAVEESAGLRLMRSAEKRAQIAAKQTPASGSELRDCLLSPYVDIVAKEFGADRFGLYGWTSEQLRGCFPELKSYSDKKERAAGMSEEALLELLYQAQKSTTRVWVSQAVNAYLQHRQEIFAAQIEEKRWGFPDSLLTLAAPRLCWICGMDGRGALLLQKACYDELRQGGELRFLGRAKPVGSPHFAGCYLLAYSDAKLLGVYRAAKESPAAGEIPASQSFVQLLEDLEKREELLARRNRFQAMTDVQPVMANEDLAAKLFPHQRVAVSWLLDTAQGFLGDDMGLGKTLSVLAAFQELKTRGETDFLLVACPNSLVKNWIREAAEWLPGVWLGELPSAKAPREKELYKLNRFGVGTLSGLVVNYETLRLEYVFPELRKLCGAHKTLLCLDESQRVKNSQSQTFQALREVAEVCGRRVLLSGTPTPKDISDIWAQFALLDQGERFGYNFYEWLASVAELGNKWSDFAVKRFIPEKVEETVARVHEVLLRRRKEEVMNLPEKIFSVRDIELSGEQKKRYEEIRQGLLVRVRAADGATFVREIDSILEEYLRAVQAASNPRLIDETWQGQPAKFLELDEIVREIVEEREGKIVIWTNYLINVRELTARYEKLGAAAFSGEVSTQRRDEIIKDFQSSGAAGIRVLVAVPAAGGVGITLTAAQTAVYVDKTWNAEHWMQSVDRIHRIGQKGAVHIVTLNACKIDEVIHWNLRRKEKAQAKVLGDGMIAAAAISAADLAPTRDELLQAVS